jgi:tetratricopeptide (TPR) repeat protein
MTAARIAATLLVGVGLVWAQEGKQGTAADRQSAGYPAYERASQLFNAKKFQECMNSLDEALRLDPKLVPALTLRAKLAMAIDRYDVAKSDLERAIAADPSSWYAQFLYGFQFYQRNELPDAVAALEKARRMNPRDPPSALYLGLAEESLGRPTEALALYRDAIRLEDAAGRLNAETLLTCARLLLLLGEFDEAERLLARATKIAPDSRDPHFEAGRLWLKKGDPARAAREGEIAIGLRGDTTDKQVHYLLVQAYEAGGKETEAARHASALRAIEAREK